MIYDPSSDHSLKKARLRFEKLIERGKPFELTDVSKRSTKQNSLLHVFLSILAIESGHTLAYTKRNIWKMRWLRDMFYVEVPNKKTGEMYKDIRSSADLNKEEMNHAIEVLIEMSFREHGVIFPDRNSATFNDDFTLMQAEVYKNQKFL